MWLLLYISAEFFWWWTERENKKPYGEKQSVERVLWHNTEAQAHKIH